MGAHGHVATKLCLKVIGILKDLSVDVWESNLQLLFDYDGIDGLANRILTGMSDWPRSADLFPNAYTRATSEPLNSLLPTLYRDVEVDLLVEVSIDARESNIGHQTNSSLAASSSTSSGTTGSLSHETAQTEEEPAPNSDVAPSGTRTSYLHFGAARSYEKVVKLACKPKVALPKDKYLDRIIAATWDEAGAIYNVCKALSSLIGEPNLIVVFKALIILHTMIQNGSTNNVLGYLSGLQVLRLSNVSTESWEDGLLNRWSAAHGSLGAGSTAPENLQRYATYLDTRIHAYRDLKHDAVRIQSDSNRDASAMNRCGHFGPTSISTAAPLQRTKTLDGRKLRLMTAEKGLLRETRTVHGMLDTLVACHIYLDDLEDPLTVTALRMLVKDVLIPFQAGNEGVLLPGVF
ncbi:hypothetical protein DFH07DRAFT_1018461 [Mycena maculata]|uniref:ENTH domain-containing protein n=1 Tax=Mycena maculata TaxID=230809 RepID=A0AAD7JH10_9AGAR|nr:hypothetical protein DFH07DRAFT_1018461 [Mycena maculata]